MTITVKTVESKRDFRKFATFANKLYKGNSYYIPTMPMDDLAVFDKKKNAAYEFCEAKFFLAYDGDRIVGRVAAIINHKANAAWNVNQVRFGWIDFIDDINVSSALLEAVSSWGKEKGMTSVVGPLGFTDFDPEGMLVEGFDRLGTMVMIYNHEYYHRHLEQLGYVKETDWKEFLIKVPEELPDKHIRVAEIVKQRLGLRVVKKTRRQIKKEKYGHKLFELINETYCNLYGYSLLSEKQIDQYVDQYLGLLDLRMVSFVENAEGELIAAGVSMPSLSIPLQKCGGNIFPTGWWHLIKAMYLKKPDTAVLLLIGVKEEYQKKGVNSLIFNDMFQNFKDLGFKYAESSAELETNTKALQLWNGLEYEQHKRRRVYGKEI
jgi:GNAT superfamily N-acetyltransferase